jgi:TRAP-type C4-dicarboxylate transport system substrate-binding protein
MTQHAKSSRPATGSRDLAAMPAAAMPAAAIPAAAIPAAAIPAAAMPAAAIPAAAIPAAAMPAAAMPAAAIPAAAMPAGAMPAAAIPAALPAPAAGQSAGPAPRLRRRALMAMAGAAGAAAIAPPARAAASVTLRLATWGASAAPQVAAFVGPFREAVTAAGKGQITVQDFPAGSLVDERDVPSAIQSNIVDIALTTMGSWASILPEAGVLNTVFFSPTTGNFVQATGPDSPLFKTLDAAMGQHGAKVLALLYNGPVVVVSRKPMTTPADFKGKTVRAFDLLTEQIVQALGGVPSTIGVADVYPALQRGTVQAAIGGLEGAVGLKEYEVGKYVLATNGVFGLLMTGYVMSQRAYAALSPSQQKIVLDAAYQAGRDANTAMMAAYGKELDVMRAHHATVTVLQPGTPEYKAFEDTLAPLAAKQKARYAAPLVAQVLGALQ